MVVKDSFIVGKYTILGFDAPPPCKCTEVLISGISYKTEIVYDAKNCIGIIGNIDATGKDVTFK